MFLNEPGVYADVSFSQVDDNFGNEFPWLAGTVNYEGRSLTGRQNIITNVCTLSNFSGKCDLRTCMHCIPVKFIILDMYNNGNYNGKVKSIGAFSDLECSRGLLRNRLSRHRCQ